MEEKRNNRAVERKLKDCLKNDRARIQVGRISHFGLMEMSRQRIRTGVLESSIEVCPTCGGTGHVRSAASVALQLLRALEEQLLRSTTHNLVARTRGEVALYVLNQKRAHLRELEERFSVTLIISADESVTGHQPFLIDKGEIAVPPPAAPRLTKVIQPDSILPEEDYEEDEDEGAEGAEGAEDAEGVESAEASDGEGEDTAERSEENGGRRRRRRRRRRNGERDGEPREARAEGDAPETDDEPAAAAGDGEAQGEADGEAEDGEDDERGDRRRRRRGRRGGRRNRREGEDAPLSASGEDEGQDEAGDEAVGGSEDRPAVSDDSEIPAVSPAATEDSPVVAHHAAPEAPAAAVAVPAPEPQAPAAATPAAVPAPVAAAADAEPAPAPTRRRSTVREKAPVRVTPAV
ncbi:MAG: ribonuclease, partial [Azorhizobium sp. 12-66-6]